MVDIMSATIFAAVLAGRGQLTTLATHEHMDGPTYSHTHTETAHSAD